MKAAVSLFVALLALGAGRAYAQKVPCADATSPCTSGFTYGFAVTSGAATQLLSFDGNRKSLIIENQPASASNVCVATGVVATMTGTLCNGVVLQPGGSWLLANYSLGNSMGGVNTNLVSAIGTSGNANVTYYFTD